MQPAPPHVFKCPFCGHLYKTGGAVQSIVPSVIELWSDGEEVYNWSGPAEDPVILCKGCNKFFARYNNSLNYGESRTINVWDIERPAKLTLNETISLLDNQQLKQELGKERDFLHETNGPKFKNQTSEDILMCAERTIRTMIVLKLNDEIRARGYEQFSSEKQSLIEENAGMLLPILRDPGDYPIALLWKAELHRYLGQFRESRNTLRKITEPHYLSAKRKMIFINLIRNRKLVLIWASHGGLSRRLKIWRSWLG